MTAHIFIPLRRFGLIALGVSWQLVLLIWASGTKREAASRRSKRGSPE